MKNAVHSLLILFTLFFFASAEKRVGGVISRDTRWNSEEGPYIIESDILIKSNARLSISPGTEILIGGSPIIDSVYQLDRVDSLTISIKVEGSLSCLGRKENRITFSPVKSEQNRYSWYGIIYKNSISEENELTGVDISGAYSGVSIRSSKVTIRSSVLEYNHIGITFSNTNSTEVVNCIIARNFASGIFAMKSNPHIFNNIIVFNRNNGLYCDGLSRVYLEYNCFYGNHDGDLLECDPELGIKVKMNKNKDSVDLANNIYSDPVFAGSVSDSLANEMDYKIPTIKSRVRDTAIAAIIFDGKPIPERTWSRSKTKYQLSRYSPCIDAGHPSQKYNDTDGSRNDIGLTGGPDHISR